MCRWLFDYFSIQRSKAFDQMYYLLTYPDIRRADIDPLMHYLKIGWKEGRNPSKHFDTNFYLRNNLDVQNANINPLVHYLRFGKAENRMPIETKMAEHSPYTAWILQYDTLSNNDKRLIRSKISRLSIKPQVSILMPLVEPTNIFFLEAIDSVLTQLYSEWELCILVNERSLPRLQQTLKENKIQDPRIKIIQGEFVSKSSSIQKVLEKSKGDYFGLLGQNDRLREHTLYLIANEINLNTQVEIIYTDHDFVDYDGLRTQPFFKPGWNPDLLCTHNYISPFCIFRSQTAKSSGGLNEEYASGQVWDLALRMSEKADASNIRHIPFILYHQRRDSSQSSSQTDDQTIKSQSQALTDHFERLKIDVQVTQTKIGFWQVTHQLKPKYPCVSIIIPTRNHANLLEKCLNSIHQKTNYPNYELIIINNQSSEESAAILLKSLQEDNRARILDYDHPFNYSAINNFAVQNASGEILIFLNNDIEILSPNWIDEMAGNAIRPEIGAVGAMLYYPNYTIQHAGLILNPKYIALHIYHQSPKGFSGDNNRAKLVQNLSAMTAACLAIEKKKFQQVGGFDENNLKIAYNDVDLCLRLIKAGYHNLWTPYAELIHHESASRGYEDTDEKKERIKVEANYMLRTWGHLLDKDPAYNPNLTVDLPDSSLAFPPRVEKPWIS